MFANFPSLNSLAPRPDANAKNTYPIMYPPVGPVSTEMPPLNPANTGIPTAPISMYTMVDSIPFRTPSVEHASIIPNGASVTGITPMGILITEHIHIIAAKIPHNTMSFVVIFILVILSIPSKHYK